MRGSRRSGIVITMAKPGNAADVPLWAKPQRGRAFAPLVPRCTSLIGNSRICLGPTSLGAPCTRERKDPGAIAAIVQTFPRQPLIYSGRSRLAGEMCRFKAQIAINGCCVVEI